MKNVMVWVFSLALIFSTSQTARAGLIHGGVKGIKKGVKESVGGTAKGVKETVGGAGKGVKGAAGGTGKAVKTVL